VSRYDDEADVFFREQAHTDGWLEADPHAPGHGRGMYAWYRAHGIVPPEHLERAIRRTELNNWKWGDECE